MRMTSRSASPRLQRRLKCFPFKTLDRLHWSVIRGNISMPGFPLLKKEAPGTLGRRGLTGGLALGACGSVRRALLGGAGKTGLHPKCRNRDPYRKNDSLQHSRYFPCHYDARLRRAETESLLSRACRVEPEQSKVRQRTSAQSATRGESRTTSADDSERILRSPCPTGLQIRSGWYLLIPFNPRMPYFV